VHEPDDPSYEVREERQVHRWRRETAGIAECASVPYGSSYVLLLGYGEVVRYMFEFVEWGGKDDPPLLEIDDMLFPFFGCDTIVAL